MKIERGSFTYEKYGFRKARITVELNPDGSVAPRAEPLLKRSFRRNKDASLDIVLYTSQGGSMPQPVPPASRSNCSEVLSYAVPHSIYAQINITMAGATITRMNLREAVFGDATDDEIIKIYRSIPGPRPKVKSLVPLWERGRFEEMVKDERDTPDLTPDPMEAIQRLIRPDHERQ